KEGNGSKFTPSKRARLPGLAIHKNPSGVWARPVTLLFGSPSSDCQVVVDQSGLCDAAMTGRFRTKKRMASNRWEGGLLMGLPRRGKRRGSSGIDSIPSLGSKIIKEKIGGVAASFWEKNKNPGLLLPHACFRLVRKLT